MIIERFLLFVFLWLLTTPAGSQSVIVLTYNIRYDNPGDGHDAWPIRRAWLCNQVKSCKPGIFGIQEGLAQQVAYLDSSFPGFRRIGVGREDGNNKGEFSAIYFDTARFSLLEQSTFWLSPTPGKVSVGWDAALERICTCGLFREIETGRKFWVFNTHFDHIGVMARKKSALLILDKINTLDKQGFPVILTGDFNDGPESEPVKIITERLQDSKSADKSMSMGPVGTFNGFDAGKPATERIDFIFTGFGAKATGYRVIREMKEGRYASDHFPVVAEIKFN